MDSKGNARKSKPCFFSLLLLCLPPSLFLLLLPPSPYASILSSSHLLFLLGLILFALILLDLVLDLVPNPRCSALVYHRPNHHRRLLLPHNLLSCITAEAALPQGCERIGCDFRPGWTKH
eukprot:763521-Hanusia_phi.AAC.8